MTAPAQPQPADAGNFSSEFAKVRGPDWLRWLAPLVGKPGAAGLELGTWKGESAEWALDNVFAGPLASYRCVDTFAGSDEHRLAGIDCSRLEQEARARLSRFGERAVVCRGLSHDWLKRFDREGLAFDFVYVDAAHDAMNVLRDSVLAFELLRPGGVLIWDDYEWAVMADEVDRPKMAIEAFLASYARRLEVLGLGWQVACRKIA